MPEPLVVELYCEDSGHQALCSALTRRIASDEGVPIRLTVMAGRGGKGRAIREFKKWQQSRRNSRVFTPDLGIIVIDANSAGPREKKRELESIVQADLWAHLAIGTPASHVERWMLYGDPDAFARVVGSPPPPDPGKRDRNGYKSLLRQTVEDAGVFVLIGPMEELSPEAAQEMDLYKASRNLPDLGALIQDVRKAFRRLST
ncbi:MAG: hypothetical protein ACQEXJ_24175 [Myxococcota bacterium]